MENNNILYKRVKNHWWIFLLFAGCFVWMIFAYIHQWGNNPPTKASLIIIAIIFVTALMLFHPGRFVFTIDNEFVSFKSAYWGRVKIHITQIKDVNVEKMSFFKMYAKRYEYHDFTGQVLKIQTKSDMVYQIAIKDAEKIKEEIEKRINKFRKDEK